MGRPSPPRRRKPSVRWDVVSSVLGLLLTGVSIFAGFMEFRLTEANKVEAERQKVSCDNAREHLQREEIAYTSLAKSVGALVGSAE